MLLQSAATPRSGRDIAVGGFPVKSFGKMLTKIVFYSFSTNVAFLRGCCKALMLPQGAEILEGAQGGSYDHP